MEYSKHTIINMNPRSAKTGQGGKGMLTSQSHVFALQTHPHFVLVSAKSTSTQQLSTSTTTRSTRTMETQLQLIPTNSQTSTFLWEDSRVKLSALLENEKDLRTLGVLFFMRLRESLKASDLGIWSLKTSKGFSITSRGELLPQSFDRYGNLVMSINADWLIVGTSEYHKTGRESSLSQVLEDNVDPKYFLSPKMQARLKKDLIAGRSKLHNAKPQDSTPTGMETMSPLER